jgi:S-adenosylmethionine:tRNA ribosyltransferase-isomerase
MDTEHFDYTLPPEAIAQHAIEPRDASRLLIASTLEEIPFRDLASLFTEGDILVVNRTRVRAARLEATRGRSGGRVEILLTRRIDDRLWEAMLRPSRRLHMGERLAVADRTVELLSEPTEGVATLAFLPSDDIEAFVGDHGTTPLPPYFTGALTSAERYQTIFASRIGSAAAPTAALHFTDDVVSSLAEAGVGIAEVILEVGLDTFRPMGDGRVEDHVIHSEQIDVSPETAEAINAARSSGGKVVAVGTTVTRTLESVADEEGTLAPYTGPTSLFITPGYRPRVIDGLITNFHAPHTTLLVLIAALVGDRWKDMYEFALEHDFRFLSFGDAMYIEIRR